MCHECRIAVAQMLLAILSDSEAHCQAMNVEVARRLGRAYTPDEQRALDYTAQGTVLVRTIARFMADPRISDHKRGETIEGMLVSDPATRVPVPVLITGAKFAHYASLFLREIASLIDRGIDARAEQDLERAAVEFTFSDVAEEIDDHRRAERFIPKREESAAHPDTADLARVVAALAGRINPNANPNGTKPQPAAPAPDYKH